MSEQTRLKISLIAFGVSFFTALFLLIFKIIPHETWLGFSIGFDLPIILAFVAAKTTENIMKFKEENRK